MRRSRRGGHSGMEFGGSGEDSFVAVVVTKLTGALLFILLLTMVIMALLPKAIDLPSSEKPSDEKDTLPLEIATPGELPEAIAGRPYVLALASKGGRGPVRWAVDGKLPEGWLMHLAGPTESGWRVINVVPSQEQFEVFAREQLIPAVQQAENVTPQLAFFPVYRLIPT